MNYIIKVFYTNSTDIRQFNAANVEQAMSIVAREKAARFVRLIELSVLLQQWQIKK